MKLLIDYAGIEKIKELYEYFPLDGVTTNPTIIAAAGRDPYETLKEIREFIGSDADLHAQVISLKAEDIVAEAYDMLAALGANTCIKIPVTREGLKAIKILASEGVRVTATAIYNPIQATLAAHAGAAFVAPYVNGIDNVGMDGMKFAKTIQETFDNQGLECQVLAASFKNTYQVQELFAHGITCITAVPEVLEGMLKNDLTTARVARFTADFEALCGEGKTMKR
ncbi:MAG: fructose-6-phosphate aldolase [Lachnospiraceae bacterium]|nr:fructose-6-phosphate aldolase [Lachnospiraceae bacterium]